MGILSVFLLKLDSQLLPGGDVDGVEDLAERTLGEFFEDLVLVVDEDLHGVVVGMEELIKGC